MSKFNLEVRALDKLTNNIVEVRKDELNNFINYYNERIEELNTCQKQKQDLMKSISDVNEENMFLKKENKKMKAYIRRLENTKVLDAELGKDSEVSKQDKIIKELEKNNELLLKKFESMEKLYLEKISELMSKNSTKSIKNSIEKTIKESIEKSIEKTFDGLLNITETDFNFDIKG